MQRKITLIMALISLCLGAFYFLIEVYDKSACWMLMVVIANQLADWEAM
jgi:hypothetical protein